MTGLPSSIKWNGKTANLIVWRVRAGQWSADYYYKKWASKNGGWNMDLCVGRLGATEQQAYNKLLRWYKEEGEAKQPKAKETKKSAKSKQQTYGTNQLF